MSRIRRKNPRTGKTAKRLRGKTVFKRRNVLAMVFLTLGVGLLLFPTVFKNYTNLKTNKSSSAKIDLSFFKNQTDLGPIKIDSQLLSDKQVVEPPERIVVPSLNVDLPVVEAKVVNGYWELSETSASHGVGSANPGEIGNAVIFAHARDELFGPLRRASKDTIVYVLTKDRWYKYRVSEIKLVDPNETQTISPTVDETLTLYTCSGFLDSKRLIIIAHPSN